MDYKYIKVLPSETCFNIFKKCFELNPVSSPRAFIKYEYEEGKVPQPNKFIEGKITIEINLKSVFTYL